MLHRIISYTLAGLVEHQLDGRAWVQGYRFRRLPGEYIRGQAGCISVVNHEHQEILVADAAFKRLHGFYIAHEFGHVVDFRSQHALTLSFHTSIGSDLENGIPAAGYWLSHNGESNLGEATADAFGLWIMMTYEDYRPIFAGTPLDTRFTDIVDEIEESLDSLATP
ncbi:MAG: hypothetical protein KDE59_24715 [Anaerolineales bacterium]|nr:hypothetical protein [Anaerolineales bacterium]